VNYVARSAIVSKRYLVKVGGVGSRADTMENPR
jgi:hypothetical protein